MATGTLSIDLEAIAGNWQALNRRSDGKAAAVVKANGYGLGVAPVAAALFSAGARQFFVAVAEEGIAVRKALGPDAEIAVFAGHMDGDTAILKDLDLIPLLNSPEQIARHRQTLPDHRFGLQLDTGMGRLGLQQADWRDAPKADAWLVMSHLACADDPDHPQNAAQCATFRQLTDGIATRRSLAATGGIDLGGNFQFDLTRPGIGLYGGLPFAEARPVVTLSLPIIQVREVAAGARVGYGATWEARRDSRIATLSAGYADGLIRAMGPAAMLWHQGTPVPLAGRVSMDLLTADITDLRELPTHLDILGADQGVDDLAAAAGTIGYEILTSLGDRYERVYKGG